MEGFDARKIRQILNVPEGDRWGVPAVIAVGECIDSELWGGAQGTMKKTERLDVNEVFFRGEFGKGYHQQQDEGDEK